MKKVLSLALALLAGTMADAQLTPVQPRPTTAALMAAGVDNTTFVTPFALANYPFTPLTGPYSPASFTANAVLLGGGTGAITPSGISSTSGGTGFTGLASITAPASTDLTLNAGSGNNNLVLTPSGIGYVKNNSTIASTSTTTGSLITAGGLAAAGNLWVGGTGNFAGLVTVSQSVAGATGFTINNANTAGYAKVTYAVGTSGWDMGVGGSTAQVMAVQNKWYVYDNSAGAARLTLDPNGVFSVLATTDATTGGAGAITSAGGIYATKQIISGAGMTVGSTIGSYNGLTTAGLGVPVIVASANITAQTAAATITSYANPATDADYEVGAQMSVTVSTTLVTTLTVTYTDVSNTSRTMILPVAQLAGSFIAAGAITGVGAWESPRMHIRAKASTTITILVASGTFTGVTFSASGTIAKFN